jgi:serine/threonine protein kinase
LALILNVTGTPKESEIRGCKEGIAFYKQNYPNNIPPKKLADMYPKANPLAIDLLSRMLEWDPEKRITVDEALAHPYLEKMHDEEDEFVCEQEFNYNFTENCKTEEIKRIVYDEILDLAANNMQALTKSESNMQDDEDEEY